MGNPQDITMHEKMKSKCFPDIEMLARGLPADESQILQLLDFIDHRYDCADFRLVCILRSLYDYSALVSPETVSAMKRTVLGFKYWMDEPGVDSMCYWSENHQLLFAACEYLAGQLYPDEVFANNGMTGAQRREHGKKAVLLWLRRRFQFGMVEWHSNTYYEEDVAPLSLLADLARDAEVAQGAVILLDLLLLDMALHQLRGYFCAASGRCYEDQKKDPDRQDVLDILEKAFGFGNRKSYDYTRLSADFILNRNYRLPKAIHDIAHSAETMIVRDSMGLDLPEVRSAFRGCEEIDDKGAFLWSMEAFTNAESVNLTMKMFRRWKLRSNVFLSDLKVLDYEALRLSGLLPAIVRLLNPVTQGIAIQRSNTYTHKTASAMLSTAQRHHPGSFGDQQHIWQATLPGGVTVFTTHPGAPFFEDNARNFSPSYWVGNGVNPDAAQHRNVCLCLYRLNVRKGLMEKERQLYTHAYFPQGRFDETRRVGDRLCAGRKGGGYIALLGSGPFEYKNEDEIIQRGVETGWAAVVADAVQYPSFDAFTEAVGSLRLTKTEKGIRLENPEGRQGFDECDLEYRGAFRVNGTTQDTNYPRLDCPFAKAERNPREFNIQSGENSLRLNLEELLREGQTM